jgi:hypothetical protein
MGHIVSTQTHTGLMLTHGNIVRKTVKKLTIPYIDVTTIAEQKYKSPVFTQL